MNNNENSNNMTNITVSIDKSERIMFYDDITGRFFLSTIDELNEAVARLNKRNEEKYIDHVIEFEMVPDPLFTSYNEFYSEIGISTLGFFDYIGWFIHNGEMLEIDYSAHFGVGAFCLAINLKCVSERDGTIVYAKPKRLSIIKKTV